MTTFDDLQAQKEAFLGRMEGWSDQRLQTRPGPGQWSTVEMLDHLVKTEIEILGAAKAGLSNARPIAPLDKLRTQFLNRVFRSERRVKVPESVPQVLPGGDLRMETVTERWDACREDLERMLTTTPQAELAKGIFRHPVGGWMGMPEVMEFFSVHLLHHGYQLSRLESYTARDMPA